MSKAVNQASSKTLPSAGQFRDERLMGVGGTKKSEFMSVSQVCMPTTIERNSNSVFFVGTNSAIVSFTKPMGKLMAL